MQTVGRILLVTVLVSCAALSTATAAIGNSTLVLVRDAKPASTIVIANDATKSARFAAYELQYHIEKITGAKLPIVSDDTNVVGTRILVGDSKAAAAMGLRGADFRPQEFLIGFRPDTLVLIGRDSDNRRPVDYDNPYTFPQAFENQGTCYATYDFLERFCGVRWYLPTELGLVCPNSKTLKLTGKDVRRSPAIKYRWSTPMSGNADLWGDTITSSQPPPPISDRDDALWNRRYRIGGEPYEANHSLEGYYERFLKIRPDWFAQGYDGLPPQLCYTNPEVIAQVVQDARDYFDGKGLQPRAIAQGDYFALVPMDGAPPWCKCPRCVEALKDGASNYVFSFANKVAIEVKKSHPDKWISTLAYSSYIDTPTKIRLESNVTIMTCLPVRNGATNPDLRKVVMKRLADWVAESNERPKFLWLYFCWPSSSGYTEQFRCFPGFFAHQLVKDVNVFRKSGMRGIFIEPSYLPFGRKSYLQDQLEWHVIWRMADDPSLDGNKLIEEFFSSYYGAAAKPMKNVYNKIESIYCNSDNYPPGPYQLQTEEIAWKYLGTEQRMEEIGALMEKARRAARTDIEKQRVGLFDRGIWQYMQAGRKDYLDHEALKGSTMQQLSVPRIAGSAGDPSRVDWSKAAAISNWRTLMGQPSDRKLEAQIAHDGDYIYLRMEELIATKTLVLTDNNVWNEDDWEIYFSGQRSLPFCQMGINSSGFHLDYAFDKNIMSFTRWESGANVVSDTKSGDRWIVYIAIPLSSLVKGGAQPGETIYMNIIRGAGGQRVEKSAFWVPTFGKYQEPSRFGALTLEK